MVAGGSSRAVVPRASEALAAFSAADVLFSGESAVAKSEVEDSNAGGAVPDPIHGGLSLARLKMLVALRGVAGISKRTTSRSHRPYRHRGERCLRNSS